MNRPDNATHTLQYMGVGGTGGYVFDNINSDGFRWLFGGSEVVRIAATTGNVGIGTSSPGSTLEIKRDSSGGGSADYPNIRLDNGNAAGYTGIYFLDDSTQTAGIEVKNDIGALQFFVPNVERMRIDAAGDLGLGTSTLKNYSGHNTFTIGNNGSGGIIAFRSSYNSGDGAEIYQNSSGDLIFNINSGLSAARITVAGRFCVNATATKFTSRGIFASVSTAEGNALEVETETTANYPLVCVNKDTSGDNSFIYFGTEAAGTARGSINYNRAAGLVAYNTTSDYRAKDILGPVQNSGATIDALKVYEGQMKGATQSRPMLVAHEAQEHTPYAVTGEKDAVNEDGTPKYQQMDVSALVPLLLAEIQSLRARVAALESK
jgi:hypothetical protein